MSGRHGGVLFVHGIVATVFLFVALAVAQSPPDTQPSPVIKAYAMTEGRLSVPAREHAALVDNIGTYGRKISTQSAIAQKFLIKGCA